MCLHALFRLYIFILLLTITAFFSHTTYACAEGKLAIGTAYKVLLSTPSQDGMLDLIAKEAFYRLGMEIEVPYFPTERSLKMADGGLTDGELNRVAGMEKNYPNLVRVDENMMDFQFVGFALQQPPLMEGKWENLKLYQVGFIKGWKILEANIGDYPNITLFHSAEALFQGLVRGRVDIIIYGKLIGLAVMKELGINNVTVLQHPFASKKMYMYLHKKHRSTAPAVADALSQMKRDGVYDEIVSKALMPYQQVLQNVAQ